MAITAAWLILTGYGEETAHCMTMPDVLYYWLVAL